MKTAVLGLGAMGSAMANRLLEAGHQVVVWNRTASRGEKLVRRGATPAPSAAEASRAAEVVITSLSDDAAVRSVVLDNGGVARALGPESVLVNMSTVSPETSRALNEAVHRRFVDAPVLGGPQVVATGQATILLGGDEGLLERFSGLFSELSAQQLRCGPAGSASAVKLVANLLLIGQLCVLSEAVATAQANEVSDAVISELVRTPLVPPALLNRLDDVIRGSHEGWFSIRLGHKDVRLVRTLAAGAGLDLSVAASVDAVLERTEAAGLGDRDIAAVVEAVRAHRLAARSSMST